MANIPSTSRPRELPMGEEEAGAELKLGEFQRIPALSLSETRLLLHVVIENRRQKQKDIRDTEFLAKTQEYLDVFARFKQKENIEAVEQILSAQTDLEPFERSQLGSLCCESAEEAKTLIPSLTNKKSDADLQELLEQISKLRNFVE